MVYTALVLREGYRGKAIPEFVAISTNRLEACVELYGYQVDGCRTELVAFNPMNDSKRYDNWQTDQIFYATVKSEYLKKRRQEMFDADVAKRKDKALRPDDV